MKRPWLLPLVPLYAAGLSAKQRWLQRRPKQLRWPVVSIGSLSAGGAGKTPVVQALAELLQRTGYNVDVLSRGYGRSSQAVARVRPSGTAAEFGDEPLLLARAGLYVWVGADRFAAGSLAEAQAPVENGVHLLDDGFQHRRLARALDIVLLTAADLEDGLLPAGNLREPLSRLRAAHAVILREEEAEQLQLSVRQLAGEVPVWSIRRQIALGTESGPVLAFCGIARPEGFFTMARAAGAQVAYESAFADHHRFSLKDVAKLIAEARRYHAAGFLTTEKDLMRLTEPMLAELQMAGPVGVAGLIATFLDEEAVLRHITAALNTDGQPRSTA